MGVHEDLKEILNCAEFVGALDLLEKVEGEKQFLEEYAKKMDGGINAARRYVDWVMTFVRTQVLIGGLAYGQVAELVNDRVLDVFLDKVHVLSKAKPGAKSDVADQENFWADVRAVRGGNPAAYRQSERFAADPAAVLRLQREVASQPFLDAIVRLVQSRGTTDDTNTVVSVYSKTAAAFLQKEIDKATFFLILEPGSIRMFLEKVCPPDYHFRSLLHDLISTQ